MRLVEAREPSMALLMSLSVKRCPEYAMSSFS
jgi:hypothetical protein